MHTIIPLKTSDAENTSLRKALLNKEFRQALAFAADQSSSFSRCLRRSSTRKLRYKFSHLQHFVQVGDQTFGQATKTELDKLIMSRKMSVLMMPKIQLHNVDKAKC